MTPVKRLRLEEPPGEGPGNEASARRNIADLVARLRFSPEEGHIWLDDTRMVLLDMPALTTLRRELVTELGIGKAREILMRIGHASGTRAAITAMKVRCDRPDIDTFLVGPQLHGLEGMVQVEPVRIEADVERGHYYSELIWRHSAEAEAHLSSFGVSAEPICWSQLGYASGYTSAFMERPILFKEVECVACGAPHCRIVGRPLSEWELSEQSHFPGRSVAPLPRAAVAGNEMVGASPGFVAAWHLLQRAAPVRTSVLLLGETGVGKEIFAKALHRASPRGEREFFAVNCAALSETLLEGELFGAERGAFTGATHSRAGWFEAANGSTLFLDEIGTLNLSAQAKLLRVLQEGEVTRVGSTQKRRIDVRLVCATNMDLNELVAKGQFRADLLHRINVFPIRIPPLRDRRDDIPSLIGRFLARFNEQMDRHVPGFTPRAVDALLQYAFPGNVRELENMIERAVVIALKDEPIDVFHLFSDHRILERRLLAPGVDGRLDERLDEADSKGLDERLADELVQVASLKDVESSLVAAALRRSGNNISQAARMLGLTRAEMRHRLQPTTLRGH
ncbi:regulatory Fis family protein [Panacagrimonas perspica]|uniref:Regulatory Fis family protein n=1 Tax=Panacagrimonas perspica TaxID=381431 RepID=A0A4S3K0P5_9GAMM|nr:sigma-54-dependent Fis family transcriptional regulator [Panacagrimonas perspica]TDU28554.1 regulatory Fis family protein [Panacagrimonas perspica]THD01492.1 hypothetical protein B1810_19495 [Panacagrimonas perspica]